MPQRSRGFTLIELVIVVAVIGVLAAVALPTYRGQVRKSNRAAVQAVMMDLANKQQFYLSSQRQYASAPSDLNVTVSSDITRVYTVTMTPAAGTPPTFTITAAPVAGTIQEPDGTLTLTSTGDKTPADKW